MTLASILGLVISKRLGLRAKLIAAGDSNPLRVHGGPVNEGQTVRLGEVGQLLRTVALSTLVIEAGLTVLIYPSLIIGGINPLVALWEAPYYAAMAFTNTGFVPNADGLTPFAQDYYLLTVLMAGVFLGSIGFPVIFTLWRHYWRFRLWSLHAKLTIITTVVLFFAGAGVILLLEYDNPFTFGSMDAWDTTFQAFFLSAMTRSGAIQRHQHRRSQRRHPHRRFDAHVRRRRFGLHRGRHQGHERWRCSPSPCSRRRRAPVGAGVRPPHPERRAARRALRRRVGGHDRRDLDRDPSAGSPMLRSNTCSSTSSRPSPRVGLSTGLTAELPEAAKYVMAATMFMGRIGTVTLAAAVAASSGRSCTRSRGKAHRWLNASAVTPPSW